MGKQKGLYRIPKPMNCHICHIPVCLLELEQGQNECDCEMYRKHECNCGPICDHHNFAFNYDESYCVFCVPPDDCAYDNEIRKTRDNILYWLKVSQHGWPSRYINQDVADKIALMLISACYRRLRTIFMDCHF